MTKQYLKQIIREVINENNTTPLLKSITNKVNIEHKNALSKQSRKTKKGFDVAPDEYIKLYDKYDKISMQKVLDVIDKIYPDLDNSVTFDVLPHLSDVHLVIFLHLIKGIANDDTKNFNKSFKNLASLQNNGKLLQITF